MKKYFSVIAILLSALCQISGIKNYDVSMRLDLKKWDLVKTIPETEYRGNPQEYELSLSKSPYKLTLKDMKGRVIWNKTNLRLSLDWGFFSYSSNNKAIVDYSKLPDDLKTGSMNLNNIVDRKGNCMLMDITYNRYVFVDQNGTEVSLPQNSTSLDYLGLFNDKYLVFCQMDSLDYISMYKDSDEEPIYPKFNLQTNYSDVKNWCVIFDKNGSIFKQFKLPDLGIVCSNDIYFDESMNYLTYEWWNPQTEAKGYVLMTTYGEVLKAENHDSSPIHVCYPAFSEDGTLWIPVTQGSDNLEILDIKTGERVFLLEDVLESQAAISNKKAGYLIYIWGRSVSVLDYSNKKWVFSQYDKNAEFWDPWISGDGKEIRITYRKDPYEPGEVRFYRLK